LLFSMPNLPRCSLVPDAKRLFQILIIIIINRVVILFYVYSLCQKVYDTEVYSFKYITLRAKLTVVQLSDIIPTLYVAH
jgi:hypothetical protein